MSDRFDQDVAEILELLSICDDMIVFMRQVDYMPKVERKLSSRIRRLLSLVGDRVARLIPISPLPVVQPGLLAVGSLKALIMTLQGYSTQAISAASAGEFLHQMGYSDSDVLWLLSQFGPAKSDSSQTILAYPGGKGG